MNGCTTTTTSLVCADDKTCPTLVGLCDCETKGLREMVRNLCPVMCNICTAATTTTPSTCKDKDICHNSCDCRDKCNHPVVGPMLRRDCPLMCGMCSGYVPIATTTTTTVSTSYNPECEDDESCPTKS